MSERKHYNEHRAGKRSFQANLRPSENDLAQGVKALRNVKTDREPLFCSYAGRSRIA